MTINKYYAAVEQRDENGNGGLYYLPMKKEFRIIDGEFSDIAMPLGFAPNGVDEFSIYNDFTEDGFLIARDANGNQMYDSNGQPIHTGQVV